MDSILLSVRNHCVGSADDNSFDDELIQHINSAFNDLHNIGCGPSRGFAIEDAETVWEEFTEDITILGSIQDFVLISVKLIFDPPTQAALLSAMERRLSKLEWHLTDRGGST